MDAPESLTLLTEKFGQKVKIITFSTMSSLVRSMISTQLGSQVYPPIRKEVNAHVIN